MYVWTPPWNVSKRKRRTLLKAVSAVGVTGLPSVAAATGNQQTVETENRPDADSIRTEELSEIESRRIFNRVRAREPVSHSIAFVRERSGGAIAHRQLSGHRIVVDGKTRYTVIDVPIRVRGDDASPLRVYNFDAGPVVAFSIGQTSYRSTPTIVETFDRKVATTAELESREPVRTNDVAASRVTPDIPDLPMPEGCLSVPVGEICDVIESIVDVIPVTVTIKFDGRTIEIPDDVVHQASGCGIIDYLERRSPDGCSLDYVEYCVDYDIGWGTLDADVGLYPCGK
jgi:hypothetical protein